MKVQQGTSGWLHCRLGTFELRLEWDLEPGSTLVLFGPSGSGKTTALRSMAGLLRPLAGRVHIDGRAVYDSATRDMDTGPSQADRLPHAAVPSLFPHLSLAKNIAYGLDARRADGADQRVGELLDAFALRGLEDRYPWELSGGQQQRVALARALATEPKLLLLDEPFAALDAGLRRALRQELRSTLSRNPIPVVLVTHDREEALVLGDEVQVIDDGKVIARGAPLEVLGQPGQAAVANLVGIENLFRMAVESRHPRDGTMRLSGLGDRAGFSLETPIDEGPSSSTGRQLVTVGIRASDIILASQEPVGSSARNRIPGTVKRIEPRPPGYTVELDCGAPLLCQVTGASLDEMSIREGQLLWAVFKASSCFLVEDSAEAVTRDSGRDTPEHPATG